MGLKYVYNERKEGDNRIMEVEEVRKMLKEFEERESRPKFQFSNVVIVEDNLVGCIVKTWGESQSRGIHYEVYVRLHRAIKEYDEHEIKHMVYNKIVEE